MSKHKADNLHYFVAKRTVDMASQYQSFFSLLLYVGDKQRQSILSVVDELTAATMNVWPCVSMNTKFWESDEGAVRSTSMLTAGRIK